MNLLYVLASPSAIAFMFAFFAPMVSEMRGGKSNL
jgi:hypothetical protein